MGGVLPYLLLAAIAGIASVMQTGVNSTLARLISSPWPAATVSFSIGALAMILFTTVTGGWGSLASATRLSWWLWSGGIFGAIIVCAAIVTVPHIGAASFVTAMVAGQLITALVLDHNGWLGLPQQSVTPVRLLGVGLVLVGVLMVRRP